MSAVARAGPAGRDRAGNVVAIDLAVRKGLAEFVRVAVGVRRGSATGLAGREAAVDAVGVAVAGDDEYALFRMRCAGAEQDGGRNYGGDRGTHRTPNRRQMRRSLRCNGDEECDDGVKVALIHLTFLFLENNGLAPKNV
jgi:hypothetical protein